VCICAVVCRVWVLDTVRALCVCVYSCASVRLCVSCVVRCVLWYHPPFAVVQVVIYSGGFGSRVCYESKEFGREFSDFGLG